MSEIMGFLDGLRPEPRLTVSEWADANRKLSQESAAEYGQWRTSRTPYLKDVMDALSVYSTYKKIIVMKGAQLGFTEAGNNWIGYIIDNSPAPTLMVQPTDDTMKRTSKMRIDPMVEASESLSKKVAKTKSRSKENTITQKKFPGGTLLMVGANSPAGLRSVPIRNLFLDEVDAYPYDLEGEGSPIELATARTRTFAKKKIFIISTPTIKDFSAIEREFNQTDQNYFHVMCPECGRYHILEFNQLNWDKTYKNVRMACPECGALIEERMKTKMLASGKWVPSHPEKSNKSVIGYHLSSFYSPFGWMSWAEIAELYDKTQQDPSKLKTFVNTVLGEVSEESGDSPEWQNIYNRREDYNINTVPSEVCFLTCGVDVQKDRLELEIVGWCADKSSYSIDFRVLLGQTVLEDVWNQLSQVLDETWLRDGIELNISKMAIDSGYNTTEVYSFCRKHPVRTIPIKGQDNLGIAVSTPKQIDYSKKGKKIGKVKVWGIGVSKLKSELYGWLKIETKEEEGILTYPPCYLHFPQYDQRYFEGLVAEKWIESKHAWKKTYERNEPLDCRIYARACSIILGIDHMKVEQIRRLGNVREVEKKQPEKKKRESIW